MIASRVFAAQHKTFSYSHLALGAIGHDDGIELPVAASRTLIRASAKPSASTLAAYGGTSRPAHY